MSTTVPPPDALPDDPAALYAIADAVTDEVTRLYQEAERVRKRIPNKRQTEEERAGLKAEYARLLAEQQVVAKRGSRAKRRAMFLERRAAQGGSDS